MIDDTNNKMYYKKYINTPEWKLLRKKALDRDNNCCRLCSSTKKLNVHHRSYPKDGWQNDCVDNLTTLCNQCHAKFHDKMEFENSIHNNVTNSMLVWNANLVTNEDGTRDFVPSGIKILTNWPNHDRNESDKYSYSLFACESKYDGMCFDQRKTYVFLEFVNLVVTYRFDPIVVHKEFLKLAEYCDGMNDGIIEEYRDLLPTDYVEERLYYD